MVGFRRPAHADDPHAEALGPFGDAAADAAHADHQQGLAGDPGVEGLLPAPRALIGDHLGHPVVEHQHRHDRVLVGARAVDPAVVGEHDVVGQPVEGREMLDSGAGGVDPAQLGRPGGDVAVIDIPAHQRVGIGDPAVEIGAIVADAAIDPVGEVGKARERRRQAVLGDLEDRAEAGIVLDMQADSLIRHRHSRPYRRVRSTHHWASCGISGSRCENRPRGASGDLSPRCCRAATALSSARVVSQRL